MRELGFGRCRRGELLSGSEFPLRVMPGLVGPGITAFTIALPITTAAAAATAAAALVAARPFAPLMRLGCKAGGCFGRGFIQHRLLRLRIIISRFGNRDLLDMRLGVALTMLAPAAPAAAAPAAARTQRRRRPSA